MPLPAPTKNAETVARVSTGVGTAVAALFFPPAALAQPVIDRVIDWWVKRPQEILVDEMKKGGLIELSDPQMVQFVPMAYKFYEAAKQGEYEQNLRLLGALIAGECAKAEPRASDFAQMARRLELLSIENLRVIALIDQIQSAGQTPGPHGTKFLAARSLARNPLNVGGLSPMTIAAALAELTGRGLLIPDGAARLDKGEEYYTPAPCFGSLLAEARTKINELAAAETPAK